MTPGQAIVDAWKREASRHGWMAGDMPPAAFVRLAELIDEAQASPRLSDHPVRGAIDSAGEQIRKLREQRGR